MERVRRSTDLVELVESFVPLKRAGAGYRALCPFHEEKTPSFHVFPESQIYKCFGCNAAGDCFSFVQKRQGLSFRESLEWLAERAGIELTRQSRDAGATSVRKSALDALEAACEFFESILLRSPLVESSLDARGISRDLRRHWRIGLAPQGWQTLHEKLNQRGFPLDAQIAAGLVARSESGRIYDRFRERITFPICDVLGRVVGFGARLLAGVEEGEKNGPKYLNSAENEIFTKRNILYGLDKIARAPRAAAGATASSEGPIVIMEGYTDVILAHAAGMRRAVATLGTALGREHAKLIKRFSPDVLLLYDGDEAGLRASERGVGILLEEGLNVRVAALPDDLDPADYILERGAAAFLSETGKGIDIIEFQSERILQRVGNSGRTEDHLRACEEVLLLISKIESVAQRETCSQILVRKFGFKETVIQLRLDGLVQKNEEARLNKNQSAAPNSRFTSELQNRTAQPAGDSRNAKAGEEMLHGILRDPSLLAIVRESGITPDLLEDPGQRSVLEAAIRCAADGEEPTHYNISNRLVHSPHRNLPADLWSKFAFGKHVRPAVVFVENAIRHLKEMQQKKDSARLLELIRREEALGNHEEARRLSLQRLQLKQIQSNRASFAADAAADAQPGWIATDPPLEARPANPVVSKPARDLDPGFTEEGFE